MNAAHLAKVPAERPVGAGKVVNFLELVRLCSCIHNKTSSWFTLRVVNAGLTRVSAGYETRV